MQYNIQNEKKFEKPNSMEIQAVKTTQTVMHIAHTVQTHVNVNRLTFGSAA